MQYYWDYAVKCLINMSHLFLGVSKNGVHSDSNKSTENADFIINKNIEWQPTFSVTQTMQ